MTKTNVQPIPSNSQRHDTPNNKTHVIKFRVTAEEKTSLELTCKLLNLSLSTFIRRAIHNVKIEKTVIVAGGGEENLTAVSTLLAQCSKVGGNLNQLARHFNSGGADTEQIRAKLLDELADLTAFRLHVEKVLGELYGEAQNFAFHSIERDGIYYRIVLFLKLVGRYDCILSVQRTGFAAEIYCRSAGQAAGDHLLAHGQLYQCQLPKDPDWLPTYRCWNHHHLSAALAAEHPFTE